jgi:spore maturation protein CgeB
MQPRGAVMKIVIFGLTITSSWGNGHATLWRGLCKALTRAGVDVEFFERDVPYYAMNRDRHEAQYGRVVLYDDWDEVRPLAKHSIRDADAVIVTSYCPDAVAAGELAFDCARGVRAFYDLDTPVTLSRLEAGEAVDYIGPRGLADYDLVLSFTGGGALGALQRRLGARRAVPLYGHVDPDVHQPVEPQSHYAAALSYLGTYSADRQPAVERLFVAPAQQRPAARFLIGGAQYPQDFPWSPNIYFVRHLPPSEHAAFFSSSRLTLNLTRRSMAQMGWCPSGRLFEAAACGTALVTDRWEGLTDFFEPGSDLFVADTGQDMLDALDADDADIARIAGAARDRVLGQHTSKHRAQELCALLEGASRSVSRETVEA